jgi:hypothetical protein
MDSYKKKVEGKKNKSAPLKKAKRSRSLSSSISLRLSFPCYRFSLAPRNAPSMSWQSAQDSEAQKSCVKEALM